MLDRFKLDGFKLDSFKLDHSFKKISFLLMLNISLFHSQVYANTAAPVAKVPVTVASTATAPATATASRDLTYDETLIGKLRQQAAPRSGEQTVYPQAIHITKVADTIRPASVVVKGEEPDRNMTLARTVYQLVYADQSTIMLDSGMDYDTHRTFGKTEEPYYHQNYQIVQKALQQAKSILFTHYHADHIGGVVRSPHFDQIAPKTFLSDDTYQLMLHHPHKETVAISEEKANKFQVYQYQHFHRIAPGVVLFEAPGHTTDSKMVYIRLANGKEFIHSVDSGWSMENILTERMKNASWVKENNQQLMQQYRWLKHLIQTEPNITVLCTHDNIQYQELVAKGVLVGGLYLRD